jgi:peptide/nickel transport system substrate-binding protein
MKKQLWGSLFLLLTVVLIAGGCKPTPAGDGQPNQDSIPVTGDWVRVYHSADPDALHPYNSRSAFATFIKEHIYMYLADYNSATMQREYTLAVGAPTVSEDGKSFTYEMRPEARWDNGDPITGADFAFSIKCMKSPLTDNAHTRGYNSFILDVQVDPANERRFTVVTNELFFHAQAGVEGVEVISRKFYDPADVLSKYTAADITSREAEFVSDTAIIRFFENFNSEKYRTDPAFIYGSGAYKVESWTTGDNVTLVRKKDWWGEQLRGKSYYFQAYVDKIIYKSINDRSTVPAVAKNGELDVIRDMAPDDFVAVRDDTSGYIYKNYDFYTPVSYNNIFIGFNCKPGIGRKPFFEDVRVRKALAHVTDIDLIIKTVYLGLGERQLGAISPVHKDEYHPTLKGYEFNPDKARQLLDEAGWIDADGNGVREKMIKGKKVEFRAEAIISNSGETGPRMLGMIAEQAQKVGMVIEVNRIDFGTLQDRAREHDFDLFGLGFSAGPLPTDLKQVWSTESWVNNGSNYFGFGDSTTDALIEQIRQTMSAEERTPLYHKFQELWIAQLPSIVIMSPTERLLVHKRFRNVNATSIRPGYKTYEFWVPKAEQKFK